MVWWHKKSRTVVQLLLDDLIPNFAHLSPPPRDPFILSRIQRPDDTMLQQQRELTIDPEDLASKGMVRILSVVTEYGPLCISDLSRKTGLNHGNVDRHVRKLVEVGLLEERRYGAVRMIKTSYTSLMISFKRDIGVKINVH